MIPYTSLQTHITTNDSKRIKLGSSVGRKPIIDDASADIITDVLIRKDRANQGVGVGGAVDILEQMHPEHTRQQLDRSFRRTVRPQLRAIGESRRSAEHDDQADSYHGPSSIAFTR